jgi:hypothetical protein
MDSEEIMDKRLSLFFAIIVSAAILSEVFDLPAIFMELAVSVGVGLILGGFAAYLVIGFGGEALEDIEISVYGLSITGFSVATFIVRHVLF